MVCDQSGAGTCVPGIASNEVCGDGLDNDCDGDEDEPDCVELFEIPCNGVDDDGDGLVDEDGPQAGCDQCAFQGEPVNLLTRQAYVRPRTAAQIALHISPDHDLTFTVGWDSVVARSDHVDDTASTSGPQHPHQRTLGIGVRSNWDHRLIIDDPNNARVVTWLTGESSVTFWKDGAEFRAQPGRNAQLVGPLSGSTWIVLTDDGDRLLFEQSPGTALHPWATGRFHARLRTLQPKSLAGFRFLTRYEGDANPAGICDDIVTGSSACVAARGLLAAVAAQWIESSGTTRDLPSFEFKYRPGGLTVRSEVLLDRILAGAFRAEGFSTSQLPVLARFAYDSPAGASARLTSISDTRHTSSLFATRFAYSWYDSPRWAIERVSEPVVDQNGAVDFATSEAFTWSGDSVATHVSRGTSLAAQSPPNANTGMTWLRNGAAETSTFNTAGGIVACGSEQCGVGDRIYASSSTHGDSLPAGPSRVVQRDGNITYVFYDDLDRRSIECEVTAGGACSLVESGNAATLTGSNGTIRRAVRTYFAGDTGVVRASVEWGNVAGNVAAFPASLDGDWAQTATVPMTDCPVLSTTRTIGGLLHAYRVSVFDHDSDNASTLTDTLNELPSAQLAGGDFALTRTTTVGTLGETPRAGTCAVLGIDRYGRRDRASFNGVAAPERRFHLGATGGWVLVEDVYRGYKNFTTIPRRSGLPSSFATQRNPGNPASTDRVYAWQECQTGTLTDLYNEEGRLVCLEVPYGNGKYLRVWETTSSSSLGITRSYAHTNESLYTLLTTTRVEAANGRLNAEGIAGGNSVEYRYTRTTPVTAATTGVSLASRIEKLSNGGVFSTTSYGYDMYGNLASAVTSGSGLTTSSQTFGGYDEDGRPHTTTVGTGGAAATTTMTYMPWGALSTITEPDGQSQENLYSAGELANVLRPKTFGSNVQSRSLDRHGRLQKIRNNSLIATGIELGRDGLGRVVAENAQDTGVVSSFEYDDVARVKFLTTGSRRERRLYDGLGRLLEVCDKTADLNAVCAPNQLQNTFVYDTLGPFAGVACPSSIFANGYTMTGNYAQGRLGYVTDSDGATAYEYDAIGRAFVVARQDGPISSFSVSNVTCTRYLHLDTDGSVDEIVYPSGRRVVYGYGADKARPTNVQTTVATSALSVVASNIAYEADSSIRSFRWFGSTSALRTVTRDSRLRITQILDTRPGGSTVSKIVYVYDADGDVTSESDSVAPTMLSANPAVGPVTRTYTQDPTRDMYGGEDGYSTTYDVEGRMLTLSGTSLGYSASQRQRVTSDVSGIFTDGSNALGQVTTIDNVGTAGVDKTLGYGLRGELKTVTQPSGTWTSHYDHELRRVRQIHPTGNTSTRFRHGIGRGILAERMESTGSFTQTEWIDVLGTPVAAIYSAHNVTAQVYSVHTDRLGVPRKAATTAGTVVRTLPMSTFGSGDPIVIGSTPGPSLGVRYAGQFWDSGSGLINNGYRSLWNGRYTSPDPLHLQSQMRFLGAQAYTYAAHRPQVNQDPDGRNPLALAALSLGVFWALGRDGPNGVRHYCPSWHVDRNKHQSGMCPARRDQCSEDSWYSYQRTAALHCGKEDVRGRLSSPSEGAQCVYDNTGTRDDTAACGGTWDYVAPCPSWGADPLSCSLRAAGHSAADILPYLACGNDGLGPPLP